MINYAKYAEYVKEGERVLGRVLLDCEGRYLYCLVEGIESVLTKEARIVLEVIVGLWASGVIERVAEEIGFIGGEYQSGEGVC